MNYFFSACFLLIPKIIQLAISLAFVHWPISSIKEDLYHFWSPYIQNKFIVDLLDIRRYQTGVNMLILNWVFILNGKMNGEILHFNNRFIYNGSNCFLSNIIL